MMLAPTARDAKIAKTNRRQPTWRRAPLPGRRRALVLVRHAQYRIKSAQAAKYEQYKFTSVAPCTPSWTKRNVGKIRVPSAKAVSMVGAATTFTSYVREHGGLIEPRSPCSANPPKERSMPDSTRAKYTYRSRYSSRRLVTTK